MKENKKDQDRVRRQETAMTIIIEEIKGHELEVERK